MTAIFVPFPADALNRSIPDRFAEQVTRHADRIAVRDRQQTLTYRELGIAVDRIALSILRHCGPAPEAIAILLDQGAVFVQATLGVLNAGKFFVPLDPTHPPARLRAMLEDSGAALILTDANRMSLAVELIGDPEQAIDLALTEAISTSSFHRPVIGSDALAYVYYTSGSTGRPKGVMDSHRNVMHNIMRYTNSLRVSADDRLTNLHSSGNSGAVSDIFGALLVGAALLTFDLRREGLVGLAAWIEHERPTIYHSAPAIFRHMAMSAGLLSSLRLIRLEGDQATPRDLDLYRARCAAGCVLVNGLGLTECGLVRQYFVDLTTPIGKLVPIGYPVQDIEVSVIDPTGSEVPAGDIGEIIIESPFLSLGYWGRPDLTEERFSIASSPPGVRRYRTGDLGRFRPDGCLEYLGRVDFQPKVRGYRIAAEEIETALLELASVREATVMVHDDGDDEPRLVAYCVASGSPPPAVSMLRQHLAERLPRDLLPSAYLWLERMPLSDDGKLDRRALPPPGRVRPPLDAPFVAPQTAIEAQLARLWAEVLHLDEVGVDDSFFDLGGDSLQGAQLLVLICDRLQVELRMQMLFENPTVAALGSAIEAQTVTPRARLMSAAIPRRDVSEPCPLSSSQERILFLSRMDPDSPLFNFPLAMRLIGPLDLDALEYALDGLVQRHEALRTIIRMVDGEATQRVEPVHRIDLSVNDLTSVPAERREAHLYDRLREKARRPFDLGRLPLIRVSLFRLAKTEHVLLFVLHHIVTDGWSEHVLFNELTASYEAALRGQSHAAPPLSIGYTDYAVWQRERLCGELRASQLAYWRQKLDGAPPYLGIVPGHALRSTVSACGATEHLDLPKSLVDALTGIAQQTQSTLFMVLLAAFKALLHRYSGTDDILVGSAISGRTEAETQMLVGCFVNLLALRTDLSGNPRFRELVRRVRQTSLEAYEHQDLPFDELVSELCPEREGRRLPVVQIAFVFEPPLPPFAPSTLTTERLDVDTGMSAFDLTFFVEPTATSLRTTAEYRSDLFDPATITHMLGHWRTLLEGVVADPGRRLSELPMLTKEERQQVLTTWNDTAVEYPADQCIHQLFEVQVARAPEALAVVFGERRLTYAELNAQANQLAHHLCELGVGPEVLVGLCLERSLKLVVGVLGILKAGGAYVPLDPSYPAERLKFMLEDTQAPVVLTQKRYVEQLPAGMGSTVCLDRDWGEIALQSVNNPECRVTANNLAYVIYTSGSTGQPKGVMIEHRPLVNHMEWMRRTFHFDCGDSVLQKTPMSFDAAMWELFVPLIVGGRMVVAPPDAHRDPAQIIRALREHSVTSVQLVPSLFRLFVQDPELTACGTLIRVFCGGEALPGDAARCFLERSHARLFNLYGPTETCIDALWWECQRDDARALIPIGRPLANLKVYVLDGQLQPAPVGVAGELYIGGDGLARGYWERPELTAERFLPDPYARQPGAKMYSTGDRARYLPDGNIEFLGRLDHQLKLRGFRIEPGEIEAALARHGQVREALVMLCEDAPGDPQLVAYVATQGETVSTSELRESLKQRLPDYMLPSAFVILNALPLTPNGKVDRRSLPAPQENRFVNDVQQPIPPRDVVEVQLFRIWEDLLEQHPVGVNYDFFELGGHSLLALQVIDRVNRMFDRDLPIDTLWHGGRTIETLASILRDRVGSGEAIWSRAVPIKPSGSRRPLFCAPVVEGHLHIYENLGRRLHPDQPLYGLPVQGADGQEPPDATIEAIAAHGIRLMRKVQSTGPYSLLGYCSAGVVAFEMARQLEAMGDSVALLVLADSNAPGNYFRVWAHMLPNALRGKELRLLQERIYQLVLHPLGLRRLRRFRKLGEVHRWALMCYKPDPIKGSAVLIRVSEGLMSRDPALGWNRFIRGGVEVRTLPGRHGDLVTDKAAAQFAAELANFLD